MTKKNTEKNILVIGSFVMDLVTKVPRAPIAGETVLGTDFKNYPGGKGANQAIAAARLGGNVTMIGKLGADAFGNEILKVLKDANVNHQYVKQVEGHPTGIGSIVLEENGENRIIVVPGANHLLKAENLDEYIDAFKKADILLVQFELDFEMNKRAIEIAYELGVPVLLNPAPGRELDEELLSKVTYLTPNETEAEIISGIKIKSIEDAEKAAKLILDKGVSTVVITLSEKGALVADSKGIRHIPSFKETAIDTVAAGDSFNGAFAYQIMEGKSVDEAVRFANAVGAITVTRKGAIPSLPYYHEVEEYLKRKEVVLT